MFEIITAVLSFMVGYLLWQQRRKYKLLPKGFPLMAYLLVWQVILLWEAFEKISLAKKLQDTTKPLTNGFYITDSTPKFENCKAFSDSKKA